MRAQAGAKQWIANEIFNCYVVIVIQYKTASVDIIVPEIGRAKDVDGSIESCPKIRHLGVCILKGQIK